MTVTVAPSTAELLAMSEALDWPERTLGRNRLASEADWRAAVDAFPPLLPPTRVRLAATFPSWMTPALVATPTARARCRAWVQRGGLTHPQPPADELRRRVAFTLNATIACAETYAAIADVVAMLPPPVRDWVTESCWFLSTGPGVLGFTFPLHLAGSLRRAALIERVPSTATAWPEPPADAPLPEELWPVVLRGDLAGAALDEAVRHEIAHAWLGHVSRDAHARAVAEAQARALTRAWTPAATHTRKGETPR